MRWLPLALFALTFCLAGYAHAAGLRLIDIPAEDDQPPLHGAMWSPCTQLAGEIDLGNLTVPGVKDCPISGDKLPLVVISHGSGGSFAGHHDTAETLADAGFVVAAINHPGNTATDMSRNLDLSEIVERPVDVKRLIDFMLSASPAAGKIGPARIGLFGFSRGGYTGLALIGADADWSNAIRRCEGATIHICDQVRNHEYPPHLAHDPRIKAAVIANPLAVYFTAASFASVKVPVQLWNTERGGDGVEPHDVVAVDKSLPVPHEYHFVANAGHFVFLTPCPANVAARRPELCTDPPGFDRVAFHKQLDADVLAFFRANLVAP
ncbi:MAG: dienelactone hydrolase [Alphaproteobacteria bacterium]|nr:dienelactone hydrolase [Alphaproteobacteria bacterium]